MVGERYRDLLAAADSIVRMRSAAEKLVDRLDSVEAAVSDAGAAVEGMFVAAVLVVRLIGSS